MLFNLMDTSTPSQKLFYYALLSFIAWTVIFAVIHTQAPLYTKNQNQYFLHGLASAGYGFLDQDWLANTVDPTPLFSLLVDYTYRVFRTDIPFYIYYALLLGVYLSSIFGIADSIFDIRKSRVKTIVFLAAFLAIHSAAFRFLLTSTLGTTYVFEGGVAGQRVLGPIFQPSSLGVLLILSVHLFLRQRIYLAVLAATLAGTFHPTYILSSAVLTAAYMWIVFWEEKRAAKALTIGVLALVLVLPIVAYVYVLYGSTPR